MKQSSRYTLDSLAGIHAILDEGKVITRLMYTAREDADLIVTALNHYHESQSSRPKAKRNTKRKPNQGTRRKRSARSKGVESADVKGTPD